MTVSKVTIPLDDLKSPLPITSTINIILIGHGYWGKKIYSTLQKLSKIKITTFDKVPSDKIWHINELDDFLEKNKNQNFFFITTPEETHFSLAKKLLSKKHHVFVEKPLSLTKNEVEQLIELAEQKNVNLFVDQTFLYDQGYQKIKTLLAKKIIGKVKKIFSVRHSQNIHKPEIQVFDDLAPHDIYLMKDLFGCLINKQEVEAIQRQNNQIIEGKITWKLNNMNWISWYSWNTFPTERKFTLIGENGSIFWEKNKNDDRVIVKDTNEKETENYLVPKDPSSLELVVKDFFSTTRQESKKKRKQRYQQYIEEAVVLESVRVQSSSL